MQVLRGVMLVLYVVMSVWLVFGSAARVALMLQGGQEVDALPIIGASIGALALLLLLAAWDDYQARR